MIAFKSRRFIGVGAASVVGLILFLVYCQLQSRLINPAIFTGFLLITMVAFLMSLNWRKRFSFLPIGRAATWLQIHIYVAWVAIITFFLHTGFRMPNGGLELTVGILFMVVAGSGIIGIFISRIIPKRLTQNGGNVTFAQIPRMKRDLKARAEEIVIKSIEETKMSTIADFYSDRLERFFIGSRREFLNHIFGLKGHLDPLLTRIKAIKRYLNPRELEIMDEVVELIKEKDTLDFQYTQQFILKTWLFVHIPLSYSLLVFGIFHGFLAFRFVGG